VTPARPGSLRPRGAAHVWRTDLGGLAPRGQGQALLSLLHISDAHVVDTVSPARCEWVEVLALGLAGPPEQRNPSRSDGARRLAGNIDPKWRGLLHMHRPQEALTHWALAAHVERLRADPLAPSTKRPYDLALATGDNIDNAQCNELAMFLAVMTGGKAQMSAQGSVLQASGELGPGPWPFWCPDAAVDDMWKPRGYPAVEDFIARASAALRCRGLGFPLASLPGNHDLMRQGTALPELDIERIAVGADKLLRRPAGLQAPDFSALFVEEPARFSEETPAPRQPKARPERPAVHPGLRQVASEPARRALDRREWLRAHVLRGVLGYNRDHVARGCADAVIDLEHARLILLDTNHPAGDYQGSIGAAQLAWLEERLAEVDRDKDRFAVVASHHGSATLVNRRPGKTGDPERQHAKAMLAALHRHASVVAWLVGHRHQHRVKAHGAAPGGRGGGFWEITTASIIDWPSQTRAIEFIRHRGGQLEICCTLQDHQARPGSLAALHHELARRYAHEFGAHHARGLMGRAGDGNLRLLRPAQH
jgi:metallophosphoesterase (TIGR03767 family)